MQVVESQGELTLIRRAPCQPVADDVVRSCKDMLAAFNLAVNVSGLDEKEIYIDLKIDPSHWSRMRKGESHFPLNKIEEFCDIVGNEILLDYFAWKRGKGLHLLKSEAERQLEAERTAREKAEEENRLLRDLIQGRKS
jgi:hypothetical protein